MRRRALEALAAGAVAVGLLAAPTAASAVNPVGFSETGSLTTGRELPGAARLLDGRVLVAGGYVGPGNTNTAEIFDPKTGTFSALTATMNAIRYAPAVATLPDGRVLIAGGYGMSSDQSSADVFNPGTGTFSPVGPLATARDSGFAVPLGDGRILVGGGYSNGDTLDSTEIFNPSTNSFSPGPTLPQEGYGFGAAVVSGGRILIAGGYSTAEGYLDKAFVFSPPSGPFDPIAPLPSKNYGPGTASLPQGRAVLAGGYNPDLSGSDRYLSSALIFNPATNTFSSEGIGSLIHRREEAAAVELNDGRVLVAGGWDGVDPLKSAEILSVPSNAFTAKVKGRKVIFSVTNEGVAQATDVSTQVATTAKKKKKPKLVKTTSKHGGPGKIKVKVKLTKRGSAQLAAKGKLKVRVVYTPDQGISATKKLKLRVAKK